MHKNASFDRIMVDKNRGNDMNKKTRLLFVLLVVFITIGFALLTVNLNINGSVSFVDGSFDVHFEDLKIESSTVESINATIDGDTTINLDGTLQKPGDYFDYSFNVMNTGTMDATLDTFAVAGLSDEQKKYFTYSVKYDYDESIVKYGDILRAGQGKKIIFHFEYLYNIDNIPSDSELNFYVRMNYINPKTVLKTNVWDHQYTGSEQTFIARKAGNYKLEIWGASGGTTAKGGGYGGYATGVVHLDSDSKLYVNVGGAGEDTFGSRGGAGGYNGGGNGGNPVRDTLLGGSGGGGATHIAFCSGKLSTLEEKLNQILIVAGGGGGTVGGINWARDFDDAGSGGGYIGSECSSNLYGNINVSLGSSQSDGYKFGQGQAGRDGTDVPGGGEGNGGAGGGLYGGFASTVQGDYTNVSGAGGSGYIGNVNLTSKAMYCYACEETDSPEIKTIKVTDVSEVPKSMNAKIGNGYARITYLGN